MTSKAYIDLAFIGSKAQWNKMALRDLIPGKGHKCLIISSTKNRYTRQQHRPNRKLIKTINADQINEELFMETNIKAGQLVRNWLCLPTERVIDRLDRLTGMLYKDVIRAQELVTTTRMQKNRPRYRIGAANARTRRHVGQIRRLEDGIARKKKSVKLVNKRKQTASTLPTKDEIKSSIRRSMHRRNQIQRKLINELNKTELTKKGHTQKNLDLWQREKDAERVINNGATDSHSEETIHIKNQSEIDKLASTKFPHIERTSTDYVRKAIEDNKPISLRIDRKEVDIAIRMLRKKKYTSPEGIKMEVFFNSIKYLNEIIYTIAEMSFLTAYIPRACRVTQGTLIPKKATGQFRVVHVSSPIAALLEHIALKRLEYRLEINRLNSVYQFGFSALRSRHDLMARIIELTLKHKHAIKQRALTVLISLDIEGAFDNVNQDALIRKMDKELRWDPLKYWLAQFVTSRTIKIRWKKLRSQTREVCTGVPQGSALGPILWNYMINNIEQGSTKPGKAELLKYADDILIVYNTDSESQGDTGAQRCLDSFLTKLDNLKLKVRPEKCSTMTIKSSRAHNTVTKSTTIHIQGERLTEVTHMNILGMTINSKLKLDKEAGKIQDSLNKTVQFLHNLKQLDTINKAEDWRTLIESFIKSRLIINN